MRVPWLPCDTGFSVGVGYTEAPVLSVEGLVPGDGACPMVRLQAALSCGSEGPASGTFGNTALVLTSVLLPGPVFLCSRTYSSASGASEIRLL